MRSGKGRWGIDIELAVLLVIPFILLLANTEWLFPAGHPTDGWQSKAFFFEGPRDWPELYETYKAARISWNLKGYVVHHVFSAHVAHYVLHIGMFCGLIAAFYLPVRNVLGRNVAFLATAAFATYSQFHTVTSFEWDYQVHDGALNALIAMYTLERAARVDAGWRKWLIWSGVFWGQGLQTVYMAAFIPAMVVWFLWLNHQGGRRPILASASWVMGGALIVTLLYCVVSYAMGGPFFFFSGIVTPFKIIVIGQSTGSFAFHPGYWAPLSEIFDTAKGFALPFATFAASVLLLARLLLVRRNAPYLQAIMLCLLVSLAAAAAGLFMHLIGHGQFARDNIIAYQVPFVFFGIAALFAYALKVSGLSVPANAGLAWATKLIALGIMVSALAFGGLVANAADGVLNLARGILGIPPNSGITYSLDVVLIASICAALYLFFPYAYRAAAAIRRYDGSAQVTILSVCLAFANNHTASISIGSYDSLNRCGYFEEQYQAVTDIFELFTEYRFGTSWFRSNEYIMNPDKDCQKDPVGYRIDYGALYGAALGMYGYSIISGKDPVYFLADPYLSTKTFDTLALERAYMLPKTFRLAVLSHGEQDQDTAVATLSRNGLRADILARKKIEYPPVLVYVSVLQVTKDDRLRAQERIDFRP
ncbi:glycosyltransferase family 39 protein [Magnetospirillum sp. UT-4]|uniref:glycosyltransferase family 39 protein n=1 Tax=Magnetospirillum sp. UT-4 TaxID=2681467 RepID=UPI0015729598|nr:glycosyltransferase family 39 protein [Magnetospirillum sp. UT-4]